MQEALPQLPAPPNWSLVVGGIGRSLIIAAVAFFIVAALGWIFAPRSKGISRFGAWGFGLGCVCLFGAFGCLATLFAFDRFEFQYVFSHGDKTNALQYKIAGVWSGQEGSFLLWAVTSSIFGLLAMRGTGEYRRWFTIPYAIFLGALSGILTYESPFKLIEVHGQVAVPPDGNGLAPSLQNYWVTIHPPTIFMGFGSLTVLFAYAFAALITGSVSNWVPKVRPWSLISLTLVGVGLCMGGLWAYETLNWGGFWAWDPVENTSFVPWALTAVFIHGLIVQANRGKWTISNLFFGGMPFLAFLYGTFLTRSGWLGDTSVHSFAEMENKALYILIGVFVLSVVSFTSLWIWRAVKLNREAKAGPEPAVVHREGAYRWGGFFLMLLGLAMAIGMSVPMFMSLFGHKPKVVEESLYHKVVPWLFIPTIALIAAGPFIGWGGTKLKPLLWRLYGPACIAFGLVGATLLLLVRSSWGTLGDFSDTVHFPFGWSVPALPWVLILVGLCYFAAIANVWRIAESFAKRKETVAILLSHIGVAVLMAGLIISRGLERKEKVNVQEGSMSTALGYAISYKGFTSKITDRNNKVLLDLKDIKGSGFTAQPGFYFVIGRDGSANPMAWPHIQRNLDHDVYLTVQGFGTDVTDPITLLPGETAKLDRFEATYVKLVREGQAGSVGTAFGAQLRIKLGSFETEVTPKLRLAKGDIDFEPAKVDPDHFITLNSINPADKSVTIQLRLAHPIVPIEIFYKPLTIFVWAGLAMLALGGFMAAWLRRNSPKPPSTGTFDDERIESDGLEVEAAPEAPSKTGVR